MQSVLQPSMIAAVAVTTVYSFPGKGILLGMYISWLLQRYWTTNYIVSTQHKVFEFMHKGEYSYISGILLLAFFCPFILNYFFSLLMSKFRLCKCSRSNVLIRLCYLIAVILGYVLCAQLCISFAVTWRLAVCAV